MSKFARENRIKPQTGREVKLIMAEWGEVLKLKERSRINPAGDLVKFYRVEAVSTGGTFFTVEIPTEEMTPEKVDEVAGKRARELDTILQI